MVVAWCLIGITEWRECLSWKRSGKVGGGCCLEEFEVVVWLKGKLESCKLKVLNTQKMLASVTVQRGTRVPTLHSRLVDPPEVELWAGPWVEVLEGTTMSSPIHQGINKLKIPQSLKCWERERLRSRPESTHYTWGRGPARGWVAGGSLSWSTKSLYTAKANPSRYHWPENASLKCLDRKEGAGCSTAAVEGR